MLLLRHYRFRLTGDRLLPVAAGSDPLPSSVTKLNPLRQKNKNHIDAVEVDE